METDKQAQCHYLANSRPVVSASATGHGLVPGDSSRNRPADFSEISRPAEKSWPGHATVPRSTPGSLVLGAPAKVIRKLTTAERGKLKWWAQKYVANGAYCLKHGINVPADDGG